MHLQFTPDIGARLLSTPEALSSEAERERSCLRFYSLAHGATSLSQTLWGLQLEDSEVGFSHNFSLSPVGADGSVPNGLQKLCPCYDPSFPSARDEYSSKID